MLRLNTDVDERALAAAAHAQGREYVLRLVQLLVLYGDEPQLLEDCADLLLAELERRAGVDQPV